MKSAFQSRILFFMLAAVVVASSCSKLKQDNKDFSSTSSTTINGDPIVPDAGKGGEAAIRVIPNHDGLNIDSCMVYIKYNSAVVPTDGQYDDSVWAMVNDDNVPVASFVGLRAGRYYLFARGWDIIRSQKVRGGLFFTIERDMATTSHIFTLPIQDYE